MAIPLGPLHSRALSSGCGDGKFPPKQLEDYAVLFVMHERQDMGAVLAEPIMLHAMRRRRRIIVGPESEELPAFQPVKSYWARRICALRMELLRERNAHPYLASGQWLLAFALTPSFSFLLQSINGGPQPLADRSFDLALIALSVERIQGLPRCIQRNMPAREFLGAVFRWHQLHQNAIRTRDAGFPFPCRRSLCRWESPQR